MRASSQGSDVGTAIAVIGMAGRFPGATGVDELWRNLRDGVESVSALSLERWAEEVAAHPVFLERPELVKFKPQVEGVDLFDAAFFGYTPREAQILDPQQRLFLECAWEALENAGYDTERYEGSIGVCAGISQSSYLINYLQWDRELNAAMGALKVGLGNMNDALATRVAYKLNLRGAAYTVQSFCSTSLVAVHLACQNLLNHESDMVLAGGVTLNVSQDVGYQYQEGGILSPDGHTRTFDARGQGMVFGNGLGCVVLKRLADAIRDGDNVRGLILGTAVNNDGAVKVGFTAPSVSGQAQVVVEALSAADVDPGTIAYVEAHGTATALGDPAEIAGLTKAWRQWTDRKQFCAIGSIKTNIGHLDAAAGIAGLIKVVLCLENRAIPPSLHFESPNPQIDFANSPFYVPSRLQAWESDTLPRRAGLSSFGIGGTNAHAILEEASGLRPSDPPEPWQLVLLSAKTETALARAAANLATHLVAHPELNLADATFTLQAGRRVFTHRRFAVVRDAADAVAALADPSRLEGGARDRQGAPVAFLFTGQGSQYVGMGAGLYESEPTFRKAVDACSETLREPLGLDLRDVLFARGRSPEEAAAELKQTRITQPALFAIEYATAQLWMSWGVRPAAMLGHSVGEYVAACLAGVFSLEDALALVAERGRLMQSIPSGAMLAVPLGEAALRPRLGNDLDLASLNTPSACVVSGSHEAVARLERELQARGVATRPLHTSHAFHSAMMDPILPAFAERVGRVARSAPRIPFVSNVTGTWITGEEAQDPEYWARHLRRAVRFSEGVRCLREEGNPVLLEVGPGNTLASFVRQHGDDAEPAAVASSLRHPREEGADRAFLLGALGRLWLAGAPVDWALVNARSRRRRVPLPTYPFERERFWPAINYEMREANSIVRGFSFERQKLDDWFYQVSWRRVLPANLLREPDWRAARSRWLVFLDEAGVGAAAAEELRRAGQTVATVRPGAAFAAAGDDYVVHPAQRTDYDALLRAFGARPTHVVHLWGVTPEDPRSIRERLVERHERGFLSLLCLAQALARAEAKQPLQITVVTSGMQDVTGGELASPEKATVIGPCRVIPQEFPNVACRSIDVTAPADAEAALELARRIVRETAAGPADTVVAYRGRHRWVQTAEATPLATANGQSPLRHRGIYLITGGLGGIGLAFARFLAERYQSRLVLTGRSPIPAREDWPALLGGAGEAATRERIRQVQDLEARGAEVLYVAGDVARREDAEAAVAAARSRFGGLHGVVHAAGVAGGGIISLKDRAVADRVLAPKVQGTLHLDEAIGAEPLDFLLLCSSTAALLGGFGQIDYCGANAFLDAYAYRCRALGRPVMAVNWDAWRDVGMAVNTPVSGVLQIARDFSLRVGIAPAEGVEVFTRILAAGLPQVAVSTMDLLPAVLRQRMRTTARGAMAAEEQPAVAMAAEDPAAAASPGLSGDLERTVAESWEKVLGRKNVGVNDNFFELGGDSLSALQAISVLKGRLGRDVPIVLFYEAPTVALLAKALGAAQSEEQPAAALEETSQRAETRLEMMQRRRRPRADAALDEPRQGG
jgi:acyl transferase domain-containing protein